MDNYNEWESDSVSFSFDFKIQIINVLYKEKMIFEKYGLYIKPDFFENLYLVVIYEKMIDFYNEHTSLPEREILKDMVANDNRINIDDDKININDIIYKIFDVEVSDSTIIYIQNLIKNFIQSQALKEAIIESIDDLGDVNKHIYIKDRIEQALMIGCDLDDLGDDVYEKNNIIERWKRRSTNTEIIRLSTGWVDVDDKLNGGVGPGEVLTFLGPANSGKSMYLVCIGANMLLQKRNVLHISLEMSEEVTEKRYDMRLLGMSYKELLSKEAVPKLKNLLSSKIGKLIVKRFPSDEITPQEIGMYIKRLETIKQFKPDVVIIDYADILKSPSKYYEKRHELDSIYKAIRNLAIKIEAPIFTATQMNREALKKQNEGKLITEENIAESYGIARIVDFAVSINNTAEDTLNNKSLLYLVRNRDGEKGVSFAMYTDFSKCMIKEWDPKIMGDFIRG